MTLSKTELKKYKKQMIEKASILFNPETFSTDNVVLNREGVRDEEKSALGSIVKSLCWALDNKVTNQHSYILSEVDKMKELLESNYAGTDSHTAAVENKTEYLQHLETTEQEIQVFKEVMEDIHMQLFSTAYVKPAPKGKRNAKVTETAASIEAKGLVAKYQK